MNPNIADQLDFQATELDLVAAALRRQAGELRTLTPPAVLPSVISIEQAAKHSGLSEWAVRQLLAGGTLREVRVGDRRLIVTASLSGP